MPPITFFQDLVIDFLPEIIVCCFIGAACGMFSVLNGVKHPHD